MGSKTECICVCLQSIFSFIYLFWRLFVCPCTSVWVYKTVSIVTHLHLHKSLHVFFYFIFMYTVCKCACVSGDAPLSRGPPALERFPHWSGMILCTCSVIHHENNTHMCWIIYLLYSMFNIYVGVLPVVSAIGFSQPASFFVLSLCEMIFKRHI